jgi:fibronectin-binding autotransporter adhesin
MDGRFTILESDCRRAVLFNGRQLRQNNVIGNVTSNGTLISTGNNTYTGGTTISAGTLQLSAGGTAGSLGSGTVNGSGTLVFNRSDSIVVDNVISGSLKVTRAGSGMLTLTGNNTYDGGTVISQGTLVVGSDTATGMGSVKVNGTLDLNGHRPTLFGLTGDATGVVRSGQTGTSLLTVNVAGSDNRLFSGGGVKGSAVVGA